MTAFIQNSYKLIQQIPPHITIVAAAKTQSVTTIQAAYNVGLRQFGHNYLQEAIAMKPELPKDITWRMIGHLQRNKLNKALEIVNTLDTLDSLHTATSLNSKCEAAGIIFPVMIEVNSAREENKSGVLPEKVLDFAEQLIPFKNLQLTGLFTMGKAYIAAEQQRLYFKLTKQLFDELKQKEASNFTIENLSMGMSASYQIAIEEGATMIRLGTALFGDRN